MNPKIILLTLTLTACATTPHGTPQNLTPLPTQPPAATTAPTDPPVTAPPITVDPLRAWILFYKDQLVADGDVISNASTAVSTAATNGDIIGTFNACADAQLNIQPMRDADAYQDESAPPEYRKMIDAYLNSLDSCIQGDYDTATTYLKESTRQTEALTALIAAAN